VRDAFEEAKHPRAAGGRFGDKPGSGDPTAHGKWWMGQRKVLHGNRVQGSRFSKVEDNPTVKRLLNGEQLSRTNQGVVALRDIAKDLGFDKPAKLVSQSDVEAQASSSKWGTLMRGAPEEHGDEIAKGEYWAGAGMYGRGLYFGQNENAQKKAEQFGDVVVPAVLPDKARVIGYEQIRAEFLKWQEDFQKLNSLSALFKRVAAGEITEEQAGKISETAPIVRAAISDETTFAAALGYDAVFVNFSEGTKYKSIAADVGANEMIVLNRSILTVGPERKRKKS
jgi:hypothetical protein